MSKEPSEVDHKDGDHPKHELSSHAKRIYAIRELLIEKGVLTQDDIQRQLDYMSTPFSLCAMRSGLCCLLPAPH